MRRSDRARLLSTFGVRGRVVRVLRAGGAREPAGGSRRGTGATRGVTGPGFGQLDVSAARLPRMPPGPPGGGCDARTPSVGGSARPRRGARREPRSNRSKTSQPKNRAAIPAVQAVSDAEAHHLRGGDHGTGLGRRHGRRRDERGGAREHRNDDSGAQHGDSRSKLVDPDADVSGLEQDLAGVIFQLFTLAGRTFATMTQRRSTSSPAIMARRPRP